MKTVFLVVFIFMTKTSFFFSQEDKQSFVVYFDNNKHRLNQVEFQKLNSFLLKLKSDQSSVYSIETFCDTNGNFNYNSILSDKRMMYIKNILKSNKIAFTKEESQGESYKINPSEVYNCSEYRKAVIVYTNKINKGVITAVVNESPVVDNKFAQLLKSADVSKSIDLDVQFVGGQAVLLNQSYSEIENLFNFLDQNPKITAFIRGHVCCSSDMNLSTQRAYTVYSMLIKKGIDPARLDFKGFDRSIPKFFPEITPMDQQGNRRVDVVFSKVN